LLTAKDLTQAELSRMCGLSRATLSRYLQAQFEAKQDSIYKIAQATNVSEAWLMGADVPMERLTPNTISNTSQLEQENHPKELLSPTQERMQLLARHLEKIPESTRARLIESFESSIDTYFDAMGIPKEEE
jgi:transcriptional regulator with XRE-family HTH domain